MCVTYASIVSVFSSKWKDLHACNSCSLVLPIFQYCCLNKFCKPCQSMFTGCKDLYHNLASPTNVKQNLLTLIPSKKWCALIQSLVWSNWASASSSCFPENSGMSMWPSYLLNLLPLSRHVVSGCLVLMWRLHAWLSWLAKRGWNIWCKWSCICHALFILIILICVML